MVTLTRAESSFARDLADDSGMSEKTVNLLAFGETSLIYTRA
ncbi:hypothetical protein OCOJLMKI_2188 [Methylobacterium iners]|uniref:Uncharacterized protein n=1 Tax=Methylobacterium iners TaxID=418707 RepID=A0ABQ4RZP0_9HYPH|nr:hypothetical protein OCOJLMKI_2188 [Methylobacterium iners]